MGYYAGQPIESAVNCFDKITLKCFNFLWVYRGVARIFKGGGGGHTVSNIIVMAFSSRNIVGCLLKKKAYKGGITGTPGPPSLRPWFIGTITDRLLINQSARSISFIL